MSFVLSVFMIVSALPSLGGFGTVVFAADGAGISSVPAVRSVTAGSGTFTLTADARFYIVSEDDPTGTDTAVYVQTASSEFAAKGIPSSSVLPIVYGDASGARTGDIVIIPQSSAVSQAQGYILTVTSSFIQLNAKDAAGVLNGLHTLLQSMVSGGTTLSCCTVSDWPDVAERSVYLDCGRIYFAPETIKALIRTLSWNKMNVLYLDFSNNNATRFFLDEMNVTVGGTAYDITTAKPSNGYLSQADMDGIIEEADRYGVQIIPTFNSPGHIGGLKSVNSSFFASATASDYDSATGKVALNILESDAYTFGQEVVKLYVDYFASKGCKSFNIAADEVTDAISGLNSTNSTFVSYVNDLNTYIKSKGMTTRMFNDGLKNVTDGISKDIGILYWTTEDVNALIEAGYSVMNMNCHAGLYYCYCQGISSAYVWNQDVDKIYDGWNPGVTSCEVYHWSSSSYSYTPKEWISDYAGEEKLLGAAFAIWTDYAFNRGKDGTTIFAENYKNMMQKIYTVAERSWSTTCTDSYSTWSGTLLAAPAGLTLTGSVDTTVLPTASSITSAGSSGGSETTPTEQTLTDTSTGITVTLTPSTTAASIEYGITISISVLYEGTKATVTLTVEITENGEPFTNGAVLKVPYDTWNEYLSSDFQIAKLLTLTADVGSAEADAVEVEFDNAGGNIVLTVPHFSDVNLYATVSDVTDPDAKDTKEIILDIGGTETVTVENVNYAEGGSDYHGPYVLDPAGVAGVTVTGSDAVPGSSVTAYSPADVTCDNLISSNRTAWTAASGYYYTPDGENYYPVYAKRSRSWGGVYTYTWGYSVTDSANDVEEIGTQETRRTSTAPDITVYTQTTETIPAKDASTTIVFTGLSAGTATVTVGNTVYTVKVRRAPIDVTYNCVCDGTVIGTGTVKAYDNLNGGYTYTITAPSISGYTYSSGTLTGTVTETTAVTLTYVVRNFEIADSITLPISIIDYRSDGLLFDYSYWQDNSYAYSLVHSYQNPTHGSYNSGTSYGSSFDGTNYGTHIANTRLEIANRFSGDILGTWSSGNYLNGGWIRTGMVEPVLGANGLPVYTSDTVYAVANLLRQGIYNSGALNSGRNANKDFINTFLTDGAARSVLASSTPDAMSAQFEAAQTYDNINNAYDLAWYLLNNLYTADSNFVTDNGHTVPRYGMATNVYNGIILKKSDDIDGNGTAGYVYDSAYATTYDKENGYIYNTGVAGDIITDKADVQGYFWPIDKEGYDSSSLYGNTTNVVDASGTQNGNFALVGTAQFTYKENDYFYFSGDDDVYLFINGKLALDLGGAHGVCYKEIRLSELDQDYYGLVAGEVATFTFFYMERCSDNSNFSMRTNIDLSVPAIDVEKKAYTANNDTEVASGSAVSSSVELIYDLIVRNNGNTNMTGFVFADTDEYGNRIYFGGTQTDTFGSGEAVLSADGPFTVWIANSVTGETVGERVTKATAAEVTAYLADLTLDPGQELHIKGLKGTFAPGTNSVFTYENTLTVTAVAGEQTLSDAAQHQIYSYDIGDTSLTYVVDFGLPVTLENLFTNVSVLDYITGVTLDSASLKYGRAVLSGSGIDYTLTYTLTSAISGTEAIVLDVELNINGTKLSSKKYITIVPATTVYYEDSVSDFVIFDGSGCTWTVDGTTEAKSQHADRVGDVGSYVYGYDDAYAAMSKFSLGSAHKVTVSGSNSATAAFSFYGTGFDIISATTNTSGTVVVSVKSADGSFSKNYLVDTYYGYSYDETNGWVPVPDTEAALWQIPVIKVENLPYGAYNVTLTVAYADIFSHGQNGGESYDFWFDAVRIYDPAGAVAGEAGSSQTIYDNAYKQDGEGWPTYTELRDMMIDADSFTADEEAVSGMIFIDGQSGEVSMADYASYGPKNELYLAPSQAVAFILGAEDNAADIQIGLKSADGKAVSYQIYAVGETGETKTLSTASDMYYSIKELAGKTVVIVNTGDTGMLSVTNIKTTYTEKPAAPAPLAFMMTRTSALSAVESVNEVLNPAPVFEPEKTEVKTENKGNKTEVTVITSPDVESVVINGKVVSEYRIDRKTGNRIWKCMTDKDADVEVYAYDENGTASEAVTETVETEDSFNQRLSSFLTGLLKNIVSALFG